MLWLVLLEILGVVVLALAWMAAILRLIETRWWSPRRPVVMAVISAGCLAVMADTLQDWAVTGILRSSFYLAAWNLGMAFFDMALTWRLGRRGRIGLRGGPVSAHADGRRRKGAAEDRPVFAAE
ncbi:MAG: hypothetical protein AAF371_06315 [Pseudomonadota bacterium]